MPTQSENHQPASEKFHWQVNLWVLIFGLIFLPILASLSHWQWTRAQEKTERLSEIESRMAAPEQELSELSRAALNALPAYTPVRFTGTADNDRILLLDNQTFQGRVGYRVVQLVAVDQGWLMVSRGWIAGSANRAERPTIAPLAKNTQFYGRVVQPSDHPMLDNKPLDADFPMRFNQLNAQHIADQLNLDVVQWIELAPGSNGALVVQWAKVNVSPAKHYGYAAQWLCMALALLVLLLFANSNLACVIRNKTSDQSQTNNKSEVAP